MLTVLATIVELFTHSSFSSKTFGNALCIENRYLDIEPVDNGTVSDARRGKSQQVQGRDYMQGSQKISKENPEAFPWLKQCCEGTGFREGALLRIT